MGDSANFPRSKKSSIVSRIRRSFRRKKESYCISCGHVTKSCPHSRETEDYENVEYCNKDDILKWLDLDVSHQGITNKTLKLKSQVCNFEP